MLADCLAELRQRVAGDVRDDRYSRILYSTDASIFQVEPYGVLLPRSIEDLHAAVDCLRRLNRMAEWDALVEQVHDRAPSFLVAALKDPYSGNLDRIQIIKGWVGKDGKAQERVYDVAVSDDRKIDKNGRCKIPVGNTVDVANATWTNTIGDPELIAVWTDPDFNPDQRAFYYARVLEIPTPRWTAYEAKRFNIKMPEEAEMVTQERAYTSPIWYTPDS